MWRRDGRSKGSKNFFKRSESNPKLPDLKALKNSSLSANPKELKDEDLAVPVFSEEDFDTPVQLSAEILQQEEQRSQIKQQLALIQTNPQLIDDEEMQALVQSELQRIVNEIEQDNWLYEPSVDTQD